MPTPILKKEILIPGKTSKMLLKAPAIACKARPGHFVMLRMSPSGERIPLTIADADAENGEITIVYLVLGKSTALLEQLNEGDSILGCLRPPGQTDEYRQTGHGNLRGRRNGYRGHAPYSKGAQKGRQPRGGHHWRAQQRFAAF